MEKSSVLVVDNDEMVRLALTVYLNASQDFEVVGTADNGLEAVEQAIQLAPEVIIMEIRMPLMDGIEATRKIRQLMPDTAVVLLSDMDNFDAVRNGMNAGASVVFPKGNPIPELTAAIHSVSNIRRTDPLKAVPLNAQFPQQPDER